LGNKYLQFEAFYVGHTQTHLGDTASMADRSVRSGRINFPNEPWNAHVSCWEFGVNYDPALGFAPRVGFRRLQPTVIYNPLWKRSTSIREVSYEF